MSRLAIDLGTNNIRVYKPGKGVVVDEPSVVAMDSVNGKIVAVGTDAKNMLGRTPDSITAAHPLQNGVIASFKITDSMLKYYFGKVLGRFRLLKPEVMVAVPAGVTSTEKKALIDACQSSGAKDTYVIKSPIAAALGAGVSISSPNGNLIIDIGGGTSEIAVIALGDVVASTCIRVGGNKMDQAIANHLRKQFSLTVGEQTAENIKINIGAALPMKNQKQMEVSGSNAVTGLPESIILKTEDIVSAIKSELDEIVLAVKSVLQKTPPELASDVMDKGIIMTGGGSKLRVIDRMMTKITGVPCQVVEEAEYCTVRGVGNALENLTEFKKSVLWSK